MGKFGVDDLATDPTYTQFRKLCSNGNYLRSSIPLTRVCKGNLPGLKNFPCYRQHFKTFLRSWDTWGVGNLVSPMGRGKNQLPNGTKVPQRQQKPKRKDLALRVLLECCCSRHDVLYLLVVVGDRFLYRLSVTIDDQS